MCWKITSKTYHYKRDYFQQSRQCGKNTAVHRVSENMDVCSLRRSRRHLGIWAEIKYSKIRGSIQHYSLVSFHLPLMRQSSFSSDPSKQCETWSQRWVTSRHLFWSLQRNFPVRMLQFVILTSWSGNTERLDSLCEASYCILLFAKKKNLSDPLKG